MDCSLDVHGLGYDPQPDLRHWRGNPLHPVADPLAQTPRRKAIAERVYWQGPAWQVLRNGVAFLHGVMDFARIDEARFIRLDVAEWLWLKALDQARPGRVSCGGFFLWSRVFGRDPGDSPHQWVPGAHWADRRPLAGASRAEMRRRLALRVGRDHVALEPGRRSLGPRP